MDDITAWKTFRKPTWEEDISLNHDSLEPFKNSPPPCKIPIDEFDLGDFFPVELLAERSFSDYVARDTYPIPSSHDREGYNPGHNTRYFLTGLADYLKIQAAAKTYGINLQSYFDFGCASGRVLRHFCAQSDVTHIWGSDINGRHIRWLNDYLPSCLKIIHNCSIPQISIADNSMDMVSAFSVFTHIDTFETAWLAEIYRILKPGGLCYLTVHDDATWKHLQNANPEDRLLKRFHRINPDFTETLKQELSDERKCFRYTDVGPYRGLVVHSRAYLRKTWGRFFEILSIQDKAHGYMQSVLIGRKKI